MDGIARIATERIDKKIKEGKVQRVTDGWTAEKERQFNSLSVSELLKDSYFTGKYGRDLYPKHRDDIIELWERRKSGVYSYPDIEGIGSGKTYKGGLIMYLLALEVLTCNDLYQKYGLSSASKIGIICASRDASKARRVTFQQLLPFFDTPFIREFFQPQVEIGEVAASKKMPSMLRFPRYNFTIFPGTGQEASALGWDIYGALMDEANYMTLVNDSKRSARTGGRIYDAAGEIYDAIESRMVSRFMKDGKVAGLIVMMSNTRYVGDFLEVKDREFREGDKRIYVTRRTMWDAHPPERHATKTFKFDKSNLQIAELDAEIAPSAKLVEIPMDMYPFFFKDPATSWRLWGDTPVASIMPYFVRTKMIDAAVNWNRRNPFDENRNRFPESYRCTDGFPRFIHIDLSRKHDAACMAMSHACGVKVIKLPDNEVSKDLIIEVKIDFIIRLDPKAMGGTIDFKIFRDYIYQLTDLGYDIQLITYDKFQSMESIDRLRERGYTVENLSVDRTTTALILSVDSDTGVEKKSTEGKYTAAYDALQSLVNCEALDVPVHYEDRENGWTQFQFEAKSLESVVENGKLIVVPSVGATDDVIQVVAGSVFNTMNNISPDEFEVMTEQKDLKDKRKKDRDNFQRMDDALYSADDDDFDVGDEDRTSFDRYLGESGGLFDGRV